MTHSFPWTLGRFGRNDIATVRQTSVRVGSVAVALLLSLAPASAVDKKSTLSNPGSSMAAAAMDTPQNETIKKVAQLISGMGYTVKSSGADYLVIQANDFVVALEPAGDGSAIYASVYYQIPKDKQPMMPYQKILDYNGHSSDYFGTSKSSDDTSNIALMNHLSLAQMSPRSLKDLIDQVTSDANRNLDLLDPSGWKSSLPDFTSK